MKTMKVRMLVEMSGTRDGVPWPPAGNPIELPEEEAKQLIAATMAIPYTSYRSTEKAVVGGVEVRDARVATERPLTTKTGPVPARKGAER